MAPSKRTDTGEAPVGGALVERLRAALAAGPPGPLCVAFSGGPDSSALLHALAGLDAARRRGLRALHVNHGLHADSHDWASHACRSAEELSIACRVLDVEVPARHPQGPEAAARDARYRSLADALTAGELLLCAQHRDDQAETFLLRALRGSGPEGLAAMRTLRPLGRGWLWRPWLSASRAEIDRYVAHHRLQCVQDPANRDARHDRSWLRHELLPMLESRWPQAARSLARSAELSGIAADLLAERDAIALAAASIGDPARIDLDLLQACPPAQQARVLRAWLARLGLPSAPASALRRILGELTGARHDSRARVEWSGARVRRWRRTLHAAAADHPLPARWEADWQVGRPLVLVNGDRIAFEPTAPVAGPLRVRARRGGERIRLPGRTHHSALKNVLQACGMPPWDRERVPLVYAEDGELLAAGDRVVSGRLQEQLESHGARLRWDRPS